MDDDKKDLKKLEDIVYRMTGKAAEEIRTSPLLPPFPPSSSNIQNLVKKIMVSDPFVSAKLAQDIHTILNEKEKIKKSYSSRNDEALTFDEAKLIFLYIIAWITSILIIVLSIKTTFNI